MNTSTLCKYRLYMQLTAFNHAEMLPRYVRSGFSCGGDTFNHAELLPHYVCTVFLCILFYLFQRYYKRELLLLMLKLYEVAFSKAQRVKLICLSPLTKNY